MSHTSGNAPLDMCAQRKFRSTCTFVQADQNLHLAHADNEDCTNVQTDLSLYWVYIRRSVYSPCYFYAIHYKAILDARLSSHWSNTLFGFPTKKGLSACSEL